MSKTISARELGSSLGLTSRSIAGRGAQELIGDVGKGGGAAGRDFVFGEEENEAGEEVVDGDGGGKFLKVAGEGSGSVGGGGVDYRLCYLAF
jgi:hypothetical protein